MEPDTLSHELRWSWELFQARCEMLEALQSLQDLLMYHNRADKPVEEWGDAEFDAFNVIVCMKGCLLWDFVEVRNYSWSIRLGGPITPEFRARYHE